MFPLMELETEVRENLNMANHPLLFCDKNYVKPYTKYELSTKVSSSNSYYLQDFQHFDQFHPNGSSSDCVFGSKTPFFNPSKGYTIVGSLNLGLYQYKQSAENGSDCGLVMEQNFQVGGGEHLSFFGGNAIDMVGLDTSLFPLNYQENKTLNLVVPDEVSSCITAENGYYRTNKNIRASLKKRKTYKGHKNTSRVKGQWTVEEDRILLHLVDKYGVRKWSHIAQMLPGRIGKQCRDRWLNHLRPDIKKDTWSEEEDMILIQAHSEIGNKWSEIAKKLFGRTENSIKNHWNATKRRQNSKRKVGSKSSKVSLLQDYIKSLNLDSSSSSNQIRQYQKKNKKLIEDTIATTHDDSPKMLVQDCQNDKPFLKYNDDDEDLDFCFDKNILFEDGYDGIDSLLDEIVPSSDGFVDDDVKTEDDHMKLLAEGSMEVEDGKKEMDLVAMILQLNEGKI